MCCSHLFTSWNYTAKGSVSFNHLTSKQNIVYCNVYQSNNLKFSRRLIHLGKWKCHATKDLHEGCISFIAISIIVHHYDPFTNKWTQSSHKFISLYSILITTKLTHPIIYWSQHNIIVYRFMRAEYRDSIWSNTRLSYRTLNG